MPLPVIVQRACLLTSGACFARYDDGASVWIGSSGNDAVIVDERSLSHRLVPQFAPATRFNARERLLLLLQIRNRYWPGAPLLYSNLLSTPSIKLPSIFSWHRVAWSRRSLIHHDDGTTTVKSIDSLVQLRLHAHRLSFTVSYPVEVDEGHWVRLEQVHSCAAPPLCWQYALSLAMTPPPSSSAPDDAHDDDDVFVVDMSLGDGAVACTARNSEALSARNRHMLTLDNALPDMDPVEIDYSADAIWRVVHGGQSVEVVFHSDQSILRSSDLLFFEHVIKPGEARMYSVANLASADLASDDHCINTSIHRACRLLQHYRRTIRPDPHPPIDRAPLMSSAERKHCTIAGVGEFVAYCDGRVTGRFYDRTIVDLDAQHEIFYIILPDGTTQTVTTSVHGEDLDRYITVCARFAEWAMMSVDERACREADMKDRDLRVQNELSRSTMFLAQMADHASAPPLSRDVAATARPIKPDLDALVKSALASSSAILERLSTHD